VRTKLRVLKQPLFPPGIAARETKGREDHERDCRQQRKHRTDGPKGKRRQSGDQIAGADQAAFPFLNIILWE
jgi:hypothetical protein